MLVLHANWTEGSLHIWAESLTVFFGTTSNVAVSGPAAMGDVALDGGTTSLVAMAAYLWVLYRADEPPHVEADADGRGKGKVRSLAEALIAIALLIRGEPRVGARRAAGQTS